MVATLAPVTASSQSVRGSPAKACGEAGCRRAGVPRRDAEPSTASVPTGCWSCRAGLLASPGSWRGRWGRGGPGPGGFLTLCAPRADPHSRFLCPTSSPLRGSSFPVAAAAAPCRCTRIPRTQSPPCCLVSRVAPARLLGFRPPSGWSTRGSEELLSPGSYVLAGMPAASPCWKAQGPPRSCLRFSPRSPHHHRPAGPRRLLATRVRRAA